MGFRNLQDKLEKIISSISEICIHYLGAYGYCDKNCPLENNKTPRKFARLINNNSPPRCLTVSGPNPGKPCIFPFKYNGKTYNGCEKDHEDETKTWCSTKVDSKGQIISE